MTRSLVELESSLCRNDGDTDSDLEELPIDERCLGKDIPLMRRAKLSKIMKRGTIEICKENERRALIRKER